MGSSSPHDNHKQHHRRSLIFHCAGSLVFLSLGVIALLELNHSF